jgi:hypothetical protein
MLTRFGEVEEDRRLTRLLAALAPLRESVTGHPLYDAVAGPSDVTVFMAHHVFAVWDFMCLLKSLQRSLTCVTVPWVPVGSRLSRRLINEIVLSEESDEAPDGGYSSHFELYRDAMAECGSDAGPIDRFLAHLAAPIPVLDALDAAGIAAGPAAFVRTSTGIMASGQPHAVAAAFACGRESLIPEMFRAFRAAGRSDPRLRLFRDYLERHVVLDEECHTPMAMQMLVELCGDDAVRWEEAEAAAAAALEARVRLWDSVRDELDVGRRSRHLVPAF